MEEKIKLSNSCFKIDGINANAMINGLPPNNKKTALWFDVKMLKFPKLITLNKGKSGFKGSGQVEELERKDIPLKYVVKESVPISLNGFSEGKLWALCERVCNCPLFSQWIPRDPYERMMFSEKIKKTFNEGKVFILRIFEIKEEYNSDEVIDKSSRHQEIKEGKNLNVTLIRPLINDKDFEDIINLTKTYVEDSKNLNNAFAPLLPARNKAKKKIKIDPKRQADIDKMKEMGLWDE